jgi:hypothetical protein
MSAYELLYDMHRSPDNVPGRDLGDVTGSGPRPPQGPEESQSNIAAQELTFDGKCWKRSMVFQEWVNPLVRDLVHSPVNLAPPLLLEINDEFVVVSRRDTKSTRETLLNAGTTSSGLTP